MVLLSDKIAFDVTQKERGRITSNYQGLKDLLEAEDFICEEFNEFPITLTTIRQYGIVFFACPDSSKFRPEEIDVLLQYVSLGGILILMNHAGGDQGRRTNLGALTSQCGIQFMNNEVLDPISNLGVESYPLIVKLNTHPILQDIPDICYRIGCSLEISNGAIVLGLSNKSADPPHKPVLALAPHGKGYLLATGSYEMFKDDVKGGIDYPNNAQLIRNLLRWIRTGSPDLTTSILLSEAPPPPEKNSSPISPKIEVATTNMNQKTLENLEQQISQFSTDIRKLKEEIKIILNANSEIKEKLNIFELNLTDLPNLDFPELNLEFQNFDSKLKHHSQVISKLQKEISSLKKALLKNEQNSLSPSQKSFPTKPPKEFVPIATPIIETDANRSNVTSHAPIFTSAAELINEKKKPLDPRVIAELKAYNQIVQILEKQHKTGFISEDMYQEKRAKFGRRIAELEQLQ